MLTALEAGQGQRRARSSPSTRCPRPGWSASRTRRRSRASSGAGTALADQYLQIRVDGDLALFQAIVQAGARRRGRSPGTVLDHDFLNEHYRGPRRAEPRTWPASTEAAVLEATGLHARRDRRRPPAYLASPTRPSSPAGRWASPSTTTRSPRSRRSSTSLLLQRQHRQARRRRRPRSAATPTCRATARWASGSGCPPTFLDALARRVRLRARRASTASTPSTRSRHCATARSRCSSPWAATSSRRSPTPRPPRRRCAAPT